jgi:hypothetical protein
MLPAEALTEAAPVFAPLHKIFVWDVDAARVHWENASPPAPLLRRGEKKNTNNKIKKCIEAFFIRDQYKKNIRNTDITSPL